MNMKKRGLSDVVAVTLIILLSIAAVVIVWTFVRSTLEKTGSEITASCVNVDLRAISCDLTANTVTIENGAGETVVDKVKIVYYDSVAGTSSVQDPTGGTCEGINALERTACTTAAAPVGTDQASVAPILGDRVCGVNTQKVDCN